MIAVRATDYIWETVDCCKLPFNGGLLKVSVKKTKQLLVSGWHPDYTVLYIWHDTVQGWLKEASPVSEEPTAKYHRVISTYEDRPFEDCIISLWWSIQSWLQFRTPFQEEDYLESKTTHKQVNIISRKIHMALKNMLHPLRAPRLFYHLFEVWGEDGKISDQAEAEEM